MILLSIFAALLIATFALWDLCADRLVASFGRLVLRVVTLGRVRISPDEDQGTAMGISAATVVVIFLAIVLLSSRVH